MSFPRLSPPATHSQERKIAPLPLRARSRSRGTTGSSPDFPSTNKTPSPSSSPEVNQSLSTSSSVFTFRGNHGSPDTISNARHRPSPAPDTPRISFQFAQQGSNVLPVERPETHTLRNTAPRSFSEPEEIPLPVSPYSPAGLNYSSLPEIATQDHEIIQPLHTMYTDEKIAISDANSPLKRGVPIIIEHRSLPTDDVSHVSPNNPPTPLWHNEELVPSQSIGGLHQRSASDASDVSANDENDDNVGSYDVRNEEAPSMSFYSDVFQTALQNGLRVANKAASAVEKLAGSSAPSSDLERLSKDAKRLGVFQCAETRTIAVLGDSGEGKSSLINSLLHFPEIAKTGDIGSACTSVVTEYRQKRRHHTAPITIVVEYLSISEIEDLIKELLWNYRQVFLPEIEEDTVNAKDYARYQRESEQAWSAIEAGFGHQRGFNRHLLSDMAEGGLAKASNQLILWAHELEWPDGGNSGTWKATADTADECCEKTSIFMQDKFWPFTKIIRVYLSAKVLETGVVLADLPGLQDTNLARVRATQTYLMKCDNIFIVAKISRAMTDQSLKSSLFNVLARHAPIEWEESGAERLNLAIVCTKSEDINHKTARREFCGPDKQISPLVMKQLDKDIENAKDNKNKILKKQLKRTQEFILIKARNNHVKEGLQAAYASKIPGGRLEVFCVSNTTYEKFSRKGNTELVRASGIPELRRFCQTITASSQLLEAKNFLQSTLASLLSSVELCLISTPPRSQIEDREQDESIHDSLREMREEVSMEIDRSKAECKNTFRETLYEYLERRNSYWEAAAEAKGKEWGSWHWTQYNAWCLNSGNHKTAKRDVNWNSDLIWKMRTELAYGWDLLKDEIPTLFKTLLQSITICFLNLESHLNVHGFAPALIQGITFRVQDLEYKFTLIRRDFRHEVELVQRIASEPNASSYIVSEMVTAYRAAAAESGTGKAARQRSIVQGRITDGTLFPLISERIQTSLDELVQRVFRKLHDEVDTILDLIDRDVNMALASKPQRVDQETPEEKRLKENLMAEIDEIKGEHAEILASISDI